MVQSRRNRKRRTRRGGEKEKVGLFHSLRHRGLLKTLSMNKDVTDPRLREEFRHSCRTKIRERKGDKISFVNPVAEKVFYTYEPMIQMRNSYKAIEDLICGYEQSKDPMKEGSQYRTSYSNYIGKTFRDYMKKGADHASVLPRKKHS